MSNHIQIHNSVRVKMIAEVRKCKLKKLYCRIIQIFLFVSGITLIIFGTSMVFLAPKLINAKIRQVIVNSQ